MNAPNADTLRRRPTTSTHQTARPQLETTADVYEFVKTHFVRKDDAEEWTFFCNCRHPGNCSIFRDDPKVVALLKGEHPCPPQIVGNRTVAGVFAFAIFASILGTFWPSFEYHLMDILTIICVLPAIVIFKLAYPGGWTAENEMLRQENR
jgi:hypothetical protein